MISDFDYISSSVTQTRLSNSINAIGKIDMIEDKCKPLSSCKNRQKESTLTESDDMSSAGSSLSSNSKGDNSNYKDLSSKDNSSPKSKRITFPVTLHKILSDPSYSDIITWLPHGRSWIVLNPKSFEEDVIPVHFEHSSYSSFCRQVNGWGFIRVKYGRDHNSYYNEVRKEKKYVTYDFYSYYFIFSIS